MKYDLIIKQIVNWLSEYSKKSKTKGFVVGISGGVDSALTSTLCAKTGLPTLCLDMPISQSNTEISRAENHINWLKSNFKNVSHKSVDLNETFGSFKSTIEDKDHSNNFLSLANTRSRLRMSTLYYFSGLYNFLVAGTGNKVEDFGVGFYTKYGDGGVDLSPIADLMKSEVYELAAFLEVPTSIQKAAPTDGLFGDSRTDEDQLGASYDDLEWAMQFTGNEDDLTDKELEILNIYRTLNSNNKHKMVPIPVFINK